jgi:hypothetical protein|tara:strand:+ start:4439 stop:5434 length:996 start_codon:yes stop_codon:yes gene_type:complete
MNIREINKPVTAASLNESLAKRFGKKINLEAFTLEQLEDARNKLRTTLSQYETNESFDSVHDSKYQKNKLFLDVLNQAVIEAEELAEKAAKPDFPDIDGDGNTKEPIGKAAKDKKDAGKGDKKSSKGLSAKQKKLPAGLQAAIAKKTESKHIDEGKAIIDNYFTSLLEGEEDKAEIVMASKDMVDRVTGWMEDTAEMQAESMLELGDAIRDEMGQAQSETFIGTVKPGLESLYTALEATRAALTAGVAQMTGEGGAEMPMGGEEEPMAEPAVDAEMEPTIDADAAEDDFAAAEPAAGGEEEAGREKRESKIAKKKMIEASRRLGTILSTKK